MGVAHQTGEVSRCKSNFCRSLYNFKTRDWGRLGKNKIFITVVKTLICKQIILQFIQEFPEKSMKY